MFNLSSMLKMILIAILVVMLGLLFGVVSYLLKTSKTDLPIVDPIIKTQCEVDADCMLTYVDDYICLPCDTSLENYKCLNIDEAKIFEGKKIDPNVMCSRCEIEFDKYICECENRKCEKVKELVEEVSITTDKMEYEMGEMVKITIENNLDEEIEFYNIAVERFNNEEWVEIRFDIECLGLCEKFQTMIDHKDSKSFSWDQKDSIGLQQVEAGKYRFRIGVWDNAWSGNGMPPMFNYYSNESIIKSDLIEVDTFGYCENDNDCYDEAFLSSCDCKYYCMNKNDKIAGCAKRCDAEIENSIVPKCVCENNKCVDISSLGSVVYMDTETVIQNLIQQMGDENVSQEIKNTIPEKLYGYGKEAIPYLIEALDDERVFDSCYELPSGYDGEPCVELLVKQECNSIVNRIIKPNPSFDYKYASYKAEDWQQWWEENQYKSLNEIRKMVRDYYRAKEEENNYPATGYRGGEYDYLDFVGDLFHDDWDWDSGQNCHGLTNLEQCSYLDWPISYGSRIAGIDNCYECLAEKNKDATICENIKDEDLAGRDNCYWRLVVVLNKAGMNSKIDFCDKFTGEWKESYKKECLKLTN